MKVLALCLALLPGFCRAWELPVVCYHRFGTERPKDDYQISAERFEAELAWLKAQGFQSVSLSQVAQALADDGAGLPAKPVCLTIDDGYTSGYEVAAPLLEKYGYRAAFFLVTETQGYGRHLNWVQARDLEARGFDIGSHTANHPNLGKPAAGMGREAYLAWVEKEVGGSARFLAKKMGHPIPWFAYPYGAFNPDVEAAARKAGYGLAFTATMGINGPGEPAFRLKRYLVTARPALAAFGRALSIRRASVALTGLADGGMIQAGTAWPIRFTAGEALPKGSQVLVDQRALRSWSGAAPLDLTLSAELKPGFHLLKVIGPFGRAKPEQQWLFQVVGAAQKACFAPWLN